MTTSVSPSVSPSVPPSATAHHGLTAHEVVLLLETDPHRGLTGQEAARRLERFGPNVLPAAQRAGPLVRVLRQLHDPLIYVLLAAGAVTAGLGEQVDSAVIFGVVADQHGDRVHPGVPGRGRPGCAAGDGAHPGHGGA